MWYACYCDATAWQTLIWHQLIEQCHKVPLHFENAWTPGHRPFPKLEVATNCSGNHWDVPITCWIITYATGLWYVLVVHTFSTGCTAGSWFVVQGSWFAPEVLQTCLPTDQTFWNFMPAHGSVMCDRQIDSNGTAYAMHHASLTQVTQWPQNMDTWATHHDYILTQSAPTVIPHNNDDKNPWMESVLFMQLTPMQDCSHLCVHILSMLHLHLIAIWSHCHHPTGDN